MSRVRALLLMTLLLVSIITWLSVVMADRWRVIITEACLCTRPLSVLRISVLDLSLRVEAVLLSIRTGVLARTVWVTVMCRCRLFESPMLCLFITALKLWGKWLTNLAVPVK